MSAKDYYGGQQQQQQQQQYYPPQGPPGQGVSFNQHLLFIWHLMIVIPFLRDTILVSPRQHINLANTMPHSK